MFIYDVLNWTLTVSFEKLACMDRMMGKDPSGSLWIAKHRSEKFCGLSVSVICKTILASTGRTRCEKRDTAVRMAQPSSTIFLNRESETWSKNSVSSEILVGSQSVSSPKSGIRLRAKRGCDRVR
jgi:hypothetical protein